MQSPTSKKTITLEGNIGAGKSTLLKLLGENLNINPVYEPTDKWQKIGGDGNLLDLFYKDTTRWAYTFQSYAFISRLNTQRESLKQNPHHQVQVLERSIYCDRFVFAKNCFESNRMTRLEWEIYKEWFGWLSEHFAPKPDGFIYLKTTPEVCYGRLRKRSRHEEDAIPVSYLEAINQKHEDWLITKKETLPSILETPVLTLDCNKEFESDSQMLKEILDKVSNFISMLTEQVPPTNIPERTPVQTSRFH